MINFALRIYNPFKHDEFKNIYCLEKLVAKNKAFKFEVTKYAHYLFEFHLDLNIVGGDHAGPSLEVNLFGYTVDIELYDTRHWDYENNCWETSLV